MDAKEPRLGFHCVEVDTFITVRFYTEQTRCLYNNLYMLTTQDVALDVPLGTYKPGTNSIMHL